MKMELFTGTQKAYLYFNIRIKLIRSKYCFHLFPPCFICYQTPENIIDYNGVNLVER